MAIVYNFISYPSPEQQWKPTDIGGCVLWLRSDLGVTKDGVDRVSEWADQSGQNNHATQAVDAKKPVWTANQLNGHPVLITDGVDDTMTLASQIDYTTYSIFAVMKHENVGAQYGMLFSSVGNNRQLGLDSGTNKMWIYTLTGFTWSDVVAVAVTNYAFYGWVISGTGAGQAAYYQNGNAYGTNQSGQSGLWNLLFEFSGGGYRIKGGTAEIMAYNSALDAANQLLLKNYAKDRYNLW